jgi:phytoene dehydrogenase-like protein
VATSLAAAQALLDDDRLEWPSGQVGLLDLSLRRAPGDAFVVSDLDEGGWLEDFSVPDPTLAPAGCSAVQIQLPLRPGDDRSVMIARLERLADLGLPGWRDRVEFRRDAIARGRTGAVDYPGRTWRDRPAIDRGDGVYLVGDQVAAPGLLSEVSMASGIHAGQLAASRLDSCTTAV